VIPSNRKLALFTGLSVLVGGIACTPPQPEVQRPVVTAYTPKYQFEVPKTELPGSAKATIAVVTYQTSRADNVSNEFNSRFVKDLQNVLVARGYGVKGPFVNKDELTFSDKKGSDFILTYGVAFTNSYADVQVSSEEAKFRQLPEQEGELLWDGTYMNLPLLGPTKNYSRGKACYYKGGLKDNAKINLTLVESMSGEKLWSKTIDISSDPEPFETSNAHAFIYGMTPAEALAKTTFYDTGMTNAALKASDKVYNNAFTAIWKHLDPEELREIKKQADEIKSKKVF